MSRPDSGGISGAPQGTALVVSDTTPVRIASLTAPQAALPTKPAPPIPAVLVTPMAKPAVGGIAAVLAMTGMLVVVSALSGPDRC